MALFSEILHIAFLQNHTGLAESELFSTYNMKTQLWAVLRIGHQDDEILVIKLLPEPRKPKLNVSDAVELGIYTAALLYL